MNFLNALVLPCLLLAAPLKGQEAALAPAEKAKVSATCFEVVVLKPDPAKDPVSYEKELPWDLVPFNIRNDPYISIGTAFAISKTTLVTAHHVFKSLHASMAYPTCFIRDSKQHVWEVDQILALDQQRDVIEFTVKGKTFDQWLALRPDFKENELVFTVGNAYGEGLVVRPGEVIGTFPEPLRGAWNLLKSSAGVNPGNSGGPLVDSQGRVLGVVLSKKDNICYSLPTAELTAVKPNAAVFFDKVNYSFTLFPDKSTTAELAFDLPLPRSYTELRKDIAAQARTRYPKGMDKLFQSLGGNLFPAGEPSEEAVAEIPTSLAPEVYFVDNTTKKWCLSGLEYKHNDLPGNGRVSFAKANDVYFFKIRRPDGTPLHDLLTNPKLSMDLVLKGSTVSRPVGGQDIRITSFGDPFLVQAHVDRFGRPWQQAIWFTAYDDGVVLTYSTQVPSGLVMAAIFTSSASLPEWSYDLPKILDYTYVPYAGELKDWVEFLGHRDRLPAPLRNMAFDFQEGHHLRFQALWAQGDLGPAQADLSGKAFFALNMGFSRAGEQAIWDLRRVSLAEDEDDNYFVLLKHLHPTPGIPEAGQKHWKEIAKQRHPYTMHTFEEDGASRIATVHPAFLKAGLPAADAPGLFTVYLARVGKVDDAEMQSRLQDLLRALSPSAGDQSVQAPPARASANATH
jgi:hypothetical protein